MEGLFGSLDSKEYIISKISPKTGTLVAFFDLSISLHYF